MAKKALNNDIGVHGQIPATFWKKLPRPFFVLAPMANVTDSSFRKIISKYGKPDVTWTEFVSADGLTSPGRENLLHDLKFANSERPVVAQLFSGYPEAMKKAVMLVSKMGFDGIDINMGCPDRSVEKQGGGAALIKDPKKALAILQAAREGAVLVAGKKLPVPISVKTRIGYNKLDLDWLRLLLEQKLPVLTVHLRTRKEMSEVDAHWDLMAEVVRLRNEISPETLIIGNGDVRSLQQAVDLTKQYGCDGVMIGRGIFGKPWFFANADKARTDSKTALDGEKSIKERLRIMVEHTKLFEKHFKDLKNFDLMKKHFKAYVSGWHGAKELRVKLMATHSAKEVAHIVKEYSKKMSK